LNEATASGLDQAELRRKTGPRPRDAGLLDLERGVNSLSASYAWCRSMLGHYENFTVGSLFFPRRLRPALAAIYAFARFSDDLADKASRGSSFPADMRKRGHSGTSPPENTQELKLRGRRLAHWTGLLDRLPESARCHPILHALNDTILSHGLSREPFRHLLSAFWQDLRQRSYADDDQLLDYCRRSANPVGRIMLRLFGLGGDRVDSGSWEKAAGLSDRVCTGLQLANFWQDLSCDLRAGRCYVPARRLAAHELPFDAQALLDQGERFAPLLREICDWARELLLEGAELVHLLPRRFRYELRLFMAGGMTILSKAEGLGGRILDRRPRLGSLEKVGLGLRCFLPQLIPVERIGQVDRAEDGRA